MKKTFFIAAIAALSLLTSCRKDVSFVDGSGPIVFTASIESSKVSVDCTSGKLSWVQGDTIVISNGTICKKYTADSDGASTSFTVASGTDPFTAAASYTATYGTAPSTGVEQIYSSIPGKTVYMEAPATECSASPDFTFSVKCGLLKLNLTASGKSVSKILVSSSEGTYTLSCPTAQSISTATDFYIALPAGTYTEYKIRDNNKNEAVKTATNSAGTVIALNRISKVTFTDLNFAPPGQGGGGDEPGGGGDEPGGGGDEPGGGGDEPGGGGSTVVYPSGSAYSLSDGSTVLKTGESISSTTSDYNAVQVTYGTLTLTNCTITKSGDTSSDGDNSSFYGVNSALFVGPTDATSYSATCTMTGGTITTSATGSNACFATREGVLNISDVTINTSSNTSRGLHATYEGHINASNVTITTQGTSCSTIATDRGGGYVYVTGGSATANGQNSAVLYSTGTIEATNLTGKSTIGEIAVVEGDNHVTMTGCNMTSGSSNRALMMLQSGSGDASGYNAAINVYNSSLTVTDSGTPLCEVPTLNMGTLTLSDVSLSVASGVLMKVDYNTQWQTSGGTGRLVLATSTGTTASPWIYTGEVTADSYSYASVNVGENVLWYGTIDKASTAKGDTLTVSGTWVLDSDANVDKLVINNGGKVIKNGHTLNYTTLSNNGQIDESSTGLSYTQTKQ